MKLYTANTCTHMFKIERTQRRAHLLSSKQLRIENGWGSQTITFCFVGNTQDMHLGALSDIFIYHNHLVVNDTAADLCVTVDDIRYRNKVTVKVRCTSTQRKSRFFPRPKQRTRHTLFIQSTTLRWTPHCPRLLQQILVIGKTSLQISTLLMLFRISFLGNNLFRPVFVLLK